MSEQTPEEQAQIRKEWDEEMAKIKAKQQAAGHIDCPRCVGSGYNDADVYGGIDCSWCPMCNGAGHFHAKELDRKLRAQQRREAKQQAEESPRPPVLSPIMAARQKVAIALEGFGDHAGEIRNPLLAGRIARVRKALEDLQLHMDSVLEVGA